MNCHHKLRKIPKGRPFGGGYYCTKCGTYKELIPKKDLQKPEQFGTLKP